MDIELYNFCEHLDSIEWIDSLANGLLSHKIDLRHSHVSTTKLEPGYQVYIGPKHTDLGGNGIMIMLDDDFKLQSYLIKRIELLPIDLK